MQDNQFSIQRRAGGELLQAGKFRKLEGDFGQSAALQSDPSALDEGQASNSIPLYLEEMLVGVERRLNRRGQHGIYNERQHGLVAIAPQPGPD